MSNDRFEKGLSIRKQVLGEEYVNTRSIMQTTSIYRYKSWSLSIAGVQSGDVRSCLNQNEVSSI